MAEATHLDDELDFLDDDELAALEAAQVMQSQADEAADDDIDFDESELAAIEAAETGSAVASAADGAAGGTQRGAPGAVLSDDAAAMDEAELHAEEQDRSCPGCPSPTVSHAQAHARARAHAKCRCTSRCRCRCRYA